MRAIATTEAFMRLSNYDNENNNENGNSIEINRIMDAMKKSALK